MLNEIKKEFLKIQDKEKARLLQRFFKTGKGEYAEGDIFLGVMVPKQRALVKKYWNSLSLQDIQELLSSNIHEHRLTALLILVKQYEKNSEKRKEIFDFYLKNTKNINNWDLVDLSAPNIVGRFIFNTGKSQIARVGIIFKLADSEDIWERRIAVLSTFYFIKNHRFDESLAIAEILLEDKHDLIHKAVGWMLREIGKRDIKTLESFLKKHHKSMPRTMLRYSIEKFPEKRRKEFLKGNP